LRNRSLNGIKRSLFWSFILKVFAFSFIYIGLVLLFFGPLKKLAILILRFVLGSRYYLYLERLYMLMVLTYIFTIGLLIYNAIAKSIRYVEILADSIDRVFRKDDDLIVFPRELKEIETKLNTIKYTAIRNEQVAKEAEQRKNDLVVYLAHDLKTPLTSVIGYLSLLAESPDMPVESRAKYTKIALDKAYRLEQLINEFFDITRFSLQNISLENGKINLSLMLLQIIDEFYPMMTEKNLSAVTHINDGIVIYGDADKLARVFDNLLRNAVSYSYENGNIEISAEVENNQAVVSFRNTGDEIPPHKLDRIFEKFFRLDTSRGTKTGGAGLGLAIAKQIIELHGGRIDAVSNKEYTEFTVILPVQS